TEPAARGAAAVRGRALFSFSAVAETSRRRRDSRARKSSGRAANVQSPIEIERGPAGRAPLSREAPIKKTMPTKAAEAFTQVVRIEKKKCLRLMIPDPLAGMLVSPLPALNTERSRM